MKKMMMVLALASLCFALAACDLGDASAPAPTTGKAQDAQKYCDPNASLACKMVQWRVSQFANADQYGYFYGFVQGDPEPVIVYVVQGAVFPVNDAVTPPDKNVPCAGGGSGACAVVQQNQQPDGTWGTNGEAYFGKLANGQYFEWLGPYAFSFQKLSLRAPHIEGCPTSGGPALCHS